MPKPRKGSFPKSKNTKKDKKAKSSDFDAENGDDMDMFMEEDEHGDFFDEEFIAPEGEDLDEMDEIDEDALAELDEEDMAGAGEDEEFDDMEGEDFDEEEGDGDEDEDDMQEDQEERVGKEYAKEEKIVIDNAKLSMVIKAINKKSKKALRMFLKIFRGIVMQGLGDEVEKKKQKKGTVKTIYEVESGSVYNKAIKFALTKIPHVLKETIEHVSMLRSIKIDL